MTRITDAALDELARLAGEATPGPWSSQAGDRYQGRRTTAVVSYGPDDVTARGAFAEVPWPDDIRAAAGWSAADADARFIAAADPATVASLVGEVRRLRAALFDVLDGSGTWYEIQENTGLPESRCREIAAMYDEMLAEYDAKLRARAALGGGQ